MAPPRKSTRPPPRSPLSSEEEAEDAPGPPLPPHPHGAEDAPGPPLAIEAEEHAAPEPAVPPAVPLELAQVTRQRFVLKNFSDDDDLEFNAHTESQQQKVQADGSPRDRGSSHMQISQIDQIIEHLQKPDIPEQ
jgi:hypothetical protein